MNNIKNIFKNNILKNIILTCLVFFTFFSPVIESEIVGIGGSGAVWADICTEGDSDYNEEKCKNKNTPTDNQNSPGKQYGVEIIMTVISAIVVFTMWIISWVGYLMHPATVFDPAIIPTLKSFWILFKNIILTLSVFILIGIALKNLFKLGSIGDLGKDIGKFIVILVLINFSWFAVKFVIDIGAIAGRVSFTLVDSFEQGKTFWDRGYRMYGPTIVQWTGDGKKDENFTKEQYNTISENYKHDICIRYYDNKDDAKKAHEDIKNKTGDFTAQCHSWVTRNEQGNKTGYENSKEFKDEKSGEVIKSEAYAYLSKNVITLYPISDDPELGYDLPTAILWSFVPIGEFYKIGAGTADFGTLLTESIFSLGTAIIMVISVLAMLIVFIQRLVYLWIFLIISPLYFFEKLLGLLNESWGNFISSVDILKPSNLIAQAILVPVGFGVLYTSIAILGGELFFNNLLEQGINAYNGVKVEDIATGSGLGSAFKLILAMGVMVGLWKGTQAVAKISGGVAEEVVKKSTEFIEKTAGGWATDQAMYSKLFMAGGNGTEGSKVNLAAEFMNKDSKNSGFYKAIHGKQLEYEKSKQLSGSMINYNDKKHFKGKSTNEEKTVNNYITKTVVTKGSYTSKELGEAIGDTTTKQKEITSQLTSVLESVKNINTDPKNVKIEVQNLKGLLKNNEKTKNLSNDELSILINSFIEKHGKGQAEILSNLDRHVINDALGIKIEIFNYGKTEDLKQFGIKTPTEISEINSKINSSDIKNKSKFGEIIGELYQEEGKYKINKILKKAGLELKDDKQTIKKIETKTDLINLIGNLKPTT